MSRESVWTLGSRILFGQMYEDVALEMKAFTGYRRVFCIASAGCSAIAMAAEHEVTAVDINPDQLAYAEARAAGSPIQIGRAERAMSAGRRLVRMAGWTPKRLERFVRLSSCEEQLRFWKSHLDRRLFRLLFDTSLAAALIAVRRLTPANSRVPQHGLGGVMRRRLERSLGRFPNAQNPYARRLFLGDERGTQPATAAVSFKCADAAAFLESCPAGSFDAFSLSNILDGATVRYEQRLKAAVTWAASPNAVVILRSLREPQTENEKQVAAEDRAMIWGSIFRGPVNSF